VWPEPNDEYIFDDGGAPGFGIEAGNVVDWLRHGVWSVLAGPMHGVWPMQLGGGPMQQGGGLLLVGPSHGVWSMQLGGGLVLAGPMHEVWLMHLGGPVHLGPQELGIPNLPHPFPFISHNFEEREILDFTIRINEAVNGILEILERVCEFIEFDELAIEQGEDCAIFLDALNHVEDDDKENGNGNRTLH
jgi:hypothetical protein